MRYVETLYPTGGAVKPYTESTMATELERIADRIERRAEAERADRARQRELLRQRIAAGRTWSQVIAEARVSRPTLAAALREPLAD